MEKTERRMLEKKTRNIEVSDLNYRVNGKEIVSGLNFELISGELLGVVGPNGAGKSTLLRLLCRTLRPSSGTIFLEGKEISQHNPQQLYKKIAFLPQTLSFDFPFSVLDVVLIGRYPHLGVFENESAEDIEIAKQCLSLVDLDGFSHRNTMTLSGGESKRVSIARVLAQKTDFIFLDEPCSHLDIHHKFTIMEMLKSIALTGRSVLTVLHDLDIASKFCDRIVVLNEGEIVALGTPAESLCQKILLSVFRVRGIRDHTSGNLVFSK